MLKIDIKEARALCAELPSIRQRLFKIGLLKTGHAMDAAVKAIGYEVAEHIENKGK